MLVEGWFLPISVFFIGSGVNTFQNYIRKLIKIALAEKQIETLVKSMIVFFTAKVSQLPVRYCPVSLKVSINCSICFWMLWRNKL